MDLLIFKNSSAVGYCSLVLVEMMTLVSSCKTPILITRLHTDLSQLAISQFPVAFFTNNLSRLLHTSHPSSLSINCWAQSTRGEPWDNTWWTLRFDSVNLWYSFFYFYIGFWRRQALGWFQTEVEGIVQDGVAEEVFFLDLVWKGSIAILFA